MGFFNTSWQELSHSGNLKNNKKFNLGPRIDRIRIFKNPVRCLKCMSWSWCPIWPLKGLDKISACGQGGTCGRVWVCEHPGNEKHHRCTGILVRAECVCIINIYQTDTKTDNRFKPILTDYLLVLPSISANFTDNDTDIHHTDIHHTDTDYPVWIHINPIPI